MISGDNHSPRPAWYTVNHRLLRPENRGGTPLLTNEPMGKTLRFSHLMSSLRSCTPVTQGCEKLRAAKWPGALERRQGGGMQ